MLRPLASARREAPLPLPTRDGASRTALAALQAAACLPLATDPFARPLYAAAAAGLAEHPGPCRVLGVAARKRWVADSAAAALAAGMRQVAVLGAGFDTLGLRLLHADPGLTVVEADRAATLAAKAAALARAGIARPWPRPAAVDLAAPRALGPALAAAGWRRGAPTCFVAEAVLEYLAAGDAVRLLAEVARLAAPDGRLACTLRFAARSDGLPAVTAAAGEPMRFLPRPEALPRLLARAGLAVIEERRGQGAGAGAFLLLAPAARPAGPLPRPPGSVSATLTRRSRRCRRMC
jgi:methyltransferase (TIGR00027 family)